MRLAPVGHAEVVAELERAVSTESAAGAQPGAAHARALPLRTGQAERTQPSYHGSPPVSSSMSSVSSPGPASQDLERAILNQDPVGSTPSHRARDTSRHRATSATPDAAPRRLRRQSARAPPCSTDALSDARSGRGRLALVGGRGRHWQEPARRRARGEGSPISGCPSCGGAAGKRAARPPSGPGSRCFGRTRIGLRLSLYVLREQLGRSASDIAHLLPELRELFPDIPEPRRTLLRRGAVPPVRLDRGFPPSAVAAAHPLLVVLDDVHAADASSSPTARARRGGDHAAHAFLIVAACRYARSSEPGDPTAAALVERRPPGEHAIFR